MTGTGIEKFVKYDTIMANMMHFIIAKSNYKQIIISGFKNTKEDLLLMKVANFVSELTNIKVIFKMNMIKYLFYKRKMKNEMPQHKIFIKEASFIAQDLINEFNSNYNLTNNDLIEIYSEYFEKGAK